ncbi:hypothetical protein VIGAN_01159200 [Vigna angularis var. angularis]|uniref:Knottin scorpion toxin-like domain-containing protein n=1 Tax=Vigna angularis var. angularis TaxID=157739 RepID=A0A0S3R0E4_PHAAN|nr:hypothetical protein VIGAN_01159200 [Vigna angularis var. angularis]
MAIPARRVLPLYAAILVVLSLILVGAESRYANGVMDLAELMNTKDTETDVLCCTENHIGSCNPGTPDDGHCNDLCITPCGKGGHCTPKHLCHCFC